MKLPYLDGVRSLSALFVFLSHAYLLQYSALPRSLPTDVFLYPHLAVDVFITLSGFCLGIASLDREQKPYWQFMSRRCRRILPPYYGAVLVAGLIYLIFFRYGRSIPLQAIGTSLLLLHDLHPEAAPYFSPTFWTIGIELRLYFLFPFFLWLYRQKGSVVTVSAAIVASGLWYLVAVAVAPSYSSRWHFLGVFFPVLFTFGLIASQSLANKRLSFWTLTGFSSLAIVFSQNIITTEAGNSRYMAALPAIDVLTGLFSAALLAFLGSLALADTKSRVIAFLSWNPLVNLAAWSYSLYLMHYPLLRVANTYLEIAGCNKWQAIALEIILVLFGCYLFSLVFERPFQRKAKPC